jgi:hypothetical protein
MDIFGLLGGIMKPVTDMITGLSASDVEKVRLKTEVMNAQNMLAGKVLEYETKLLEAQSKIVTAEAQGQSWLQRNWRPITMMTFLVLVVFDSFGLLAFRLSSEAWGLLQLGLGGYVVGRTVEKVAPSIINAVKGE